MNRSIWKNMGIALLGVLGLILVAVIAYVLYVLCTYSRIPDRQALTVEGKSSFAAVEANKPYTVVTQNIGFGAYTPDFTFFMDGGKESRAASRESVESCTAAGIAAVKELHPDFVLLQEVDFDSTRSYHVDQQQLFKEAFSGYAGITAVNYHSAYLMYPLTCPHGASRSGLLTLSRAEVTSSLRRRFPISTSFSKFLDLDRCYSVSRIPTKNGKELVLYNIHSSAYGGSDAIRSAQMSMLMEDMQREYAAGNYVVGGGDFNHDFTGDSTQKINGGSDVSFGWAQPFPAELIPQGIRRCTDYKDGRLLPTCRNCDVPYQEGNFAVIVDGFLVSDNVECVEVENIQTGFAYSDHNPVKMTFRLKE